MRERGMVLDRSEGGGVVGKDVRSVEGLRSCERKGEWKGLLWELGRAASGSGKCKALAGESGSENACTNYNSINIMTKYIDALKGKFAREVSSTLSIMTPLRSLPRQYFSGHLLSLKR